MIIETGSESHNQVGQAVNACISCASPNFTQRYKRFANASTFTQIAVLLWCYNEEMGTANSLHASV